MSKLYIDLETVLKEKNVSKNKLCINCSMQRTQLNNYCKNKVRGVDLTLLGRMCKYLECTPNDILKFKDDEEQDKYSKAGAGFPDTCFLSKNIEQCLVIIVKME